MPRPLRKDGMTAKSAYAKRHPDRHRAHVAVFNAVRCGTLTRLPCEVCGEPKSEGHHPDYSKPLEVQWLCREHHLAEHRRLKSVAYEKWKVQHAINMEAWRKTRAEQDAIHAAAVKARYAQLEAERAARPSKQKTAREMAAAGASLTEIARCIGLTLSGACRLTKRHGIVGTWHPKPPVEIDRATVERLAADGETQAEIGRHFGVSPTAICLFMKAHGIKPGGVIRREASTKTGAA